jgi:hypothetical protein
MYYRIWYQGNNSGSIAGWYYAESPDGFMWYNHIAVSQYGTPVFSAAVGVTYGIADVVYNPSASNTGTNWTFRIYANVQWELGAHGGDELVVMAFSENGYDWTGYDPESVGYATPVFEGTLNPVDFDSTFIGWFKVIENSPTDWQAFYSGGNTSTFQAYNGIGYATSIDGINWVRQQTILTSSSGIAWCNESVWMPSVMKLANNSFQLWFLGSNNSDIGASNWIQWQLGLLTLNPYVSPTTTTTTTTTTNTATTSSTQTGTSTPASAFSGIAPWIFGSLIGAGIMTVILAGTFRIFGRNRKIYPNLT